MVVAISLKQVDFWILEKMISTREEEISIVKIFILIKEVDINRYFYDKNRT